MCIVNNRIAIPLDKRKLRIFNKQTIYNVENKILYIGVTEVKHKLIAEIMLRPVGFTNHPILMLFIQLTFWTYHFRFQPDPKFYTGFLCFFYKIPDAVRKLFYIF